MFFCLAAGEAYSLPHNSDKGWGPHPQQWQIWWINEQSASSWEVTGSYFQCSDWWLLSFISCSNQYVSLLVNVIDKMDRLTLLKFIIWNFLHAVSMVDTISIILKFYFINSAVDQVHTSFLFPILCMYTWQCIYRIWRRIVRYFFSFLSPFLAWCVLSTDAYNILILLRFVTQNFDK